MPQNRIMAYRALLRDCFQTALARVEPKQAIIAGFKSHPVPGLAAGGQYYVLAFGKAACPMAEASLTLLPKDQIGRCLVITNQENYYQIDGAEILISSHPIPDERGVQASQQVIDMLSNLKAEDQLICLISGGGSALLPAPAEGISFEDKMLSNQLMLKADMPIHHINMVRQHLSALKGGGLRQLAEPAKVTSYILSDVIGNDLNVIASGPTMGKIGTKAQACDILKSYNLWSAIPPSVQSLLQGSDQHNISATEQLQYQKNSHLVASNQSCLEVIKLKLQDKFQAIILTDQLGGNVSEAANYLCKQALKYYPQKPIALIAGGETTVKVTGSGKGGRNQELALYVARALQQKTDFGNWVFMSAGTDGRDGPTDAAGAIVDDNSLHRLSEAAIDLDAILEQNDSYHALSASGDLLITGGTGTNVADIQVLMIC